MSSAWVGSCLCSGGWCMVPKVGLISTAVPLPCFHSGVWSGWFVCLALCESLWPTPKYHPWKWNLVYKTLMHPALRRCSYRLDPWLLFGKSSHINGQQTPQVWCEMGIAELFWPTGAVPICSELPSSRCLCKMRWDWFDMVWRSCTFTADSCWDNAWCLQRRSGWLDFGVQKPLVAGHSLVVCMRLGCPGLCHSLG